MSASGRPPRTRAPSPLFPVLLVLLVAAAVATPARARAGRGAQGPPPADRDLQLEELAELSLEELMGIEVTSVAGVPQSWFSSPAAIYVITGDEVRRSGFRSIAEVLRMVPGMFVGQQSSH